MSIQKRNEKAFVVSLSLLPLPSGKNKGNQKDVGGASGPNLSNRERRQ